MSKKIATAAGALLAATSLSWTVGTARADIVHADDVIIQGSLCVGLDCVNGENFGFDTIRLKENNLRIHFDDTSVGTFPANDWRIIANDSASGGANYLAIEDSTAGRQIFRATAGAPANSLFIASTGRIGLRTSTPILDLHLLTSNTPGIRLDQSNAGGFTAQTWDVAGNEANFFVRDVTGGSRLSFRIRPGAPTSSIDIAANGDVGFGTASPAGPLHVARAGDSFLQLQNTSGGGKTWSYSNISGEARIVSPDGPGAEFRLATTGDLTTTGSLHVERAGSSFVELKDTGAGGKAWNYSNISGEARIVSPDGPGVEFALTSAGNLTITGQLTTAGSCSVGCDRVFDADYKLPSIREHAEAMYADKHLPAVGPTKEGQPINVSAKLEGMLNELEKAHIYVAELERRLSALEQTRDANR